MTIEHADARSEMMGDPDLSPTAHAIRLERLEGRQNSLEQLVRHSTENLQRSLDGLTQLLHKWSGENKDAQKEWAQIHEAENENEFRDLYKEVQDVRNETGKVRESNIRWVSIGVGIGIVGASLITGFLWALDQQFAVVKEDALRMEERLDYQRTRIDKQQDEIYDLKLYLARGGRIPVGPYVPPSQREKDNGQ